MFDDIDLAPVNVDGGALVTRGPYESAKEIWDWALKLVPTGTVFNVCGHSLGGWRTAYTAMFIPVRGLDSPAGRNALAERGRLRNHPHGRLGWRHQPG